MYIRILRNNKCKTVPSMTVHVFVLNNPTYVLVYIAETVTLNKAVFLIHLIRQSEFIFQTRNNNCNDMVFFKFYIDFIVLHSFTVEPT